MPQILPRAPTQYFDLNGDPLANGFIYFYEPGTTTNKLTWADEDLSTPNANPVQLDGDGFSDSGGIWGIGAYRQIIEDENNVQISDRVTSAWPDPQSLDLAMTAGGTANALVLTTASDTQISGIVQTDYQNHLAVSFPIAADSTLTALSARVESLGIKKIYLDTQAGPTAVIPAGLAQAGNLLRLVFDQALDAGAGGWHLDGPALSSYLYALITSTASDITTLAARVTSLESKLMRFEPSGNQATVQWPLRDDANRCIQATFGAATPVIKGVTFAVTLSAPYDDANSYSIAAVASIAGVPPVVTFNINNKTGAGWGFENTVATSENIGINYITLGVADLTIPP